MNISKWVLVDQGQAGESFGKLAGGPLSFKEIAGAASQGAKDSPRRKQAIRIGVWDLGSRIGYLSRLITTMNRVQRRFQFFEVIAAVPAGIISQPERMLKWYRSSGGKMPEKRRQEIIENLIAEDFHERAEPIRKNQGLAFLVGLVPARIAFKGTDGPHWNYISYVDYPYLNIVVSTADFREFAQQGQRPVEALVGWAILSQLLVARVWSESYTTEAGKILDHHKEDQPDTGCLFDFNRERHTIVKGLVKAWIEPACLDLVHPDDKRVALSLVKMLGEYRESES